MSKREPHPPESSPVAGEGGSLLRQTILEYQAIFDHAPVGIALSRNRRIQHANRRFEEMFGWSHGGLEDQPGSVTWATPESYVEVGRLAAQRLARGELLEIEREMRRRDGSTFWARVRAMPIEPEHPSKGATVWIIEDITEQRQAMQTLQVSQHELEARVKERTEALALAYAQLRRETEERETAENQVRHLAEHDALTGLPNRRLLELRLRQALHDAREQGGCVAVMFMDLDRFKTINDSLGHVVGDRLLQQVALRVHQCMRRPDTVARLGGDEFVMLLPGLSGAGDAAMVASQLIDEVAKPYEIDTLELRVTPSVGISLFPDHGDTPDVLVGKASAAMYQAKAQGRRSYLFFSGQTDASSSQRLLLENDLHRAIERGEFVLHYQPRYELASGMLCACEALLRWQHPTRGSISPVEFVPLAEESGLVVPIGEWVLREACQQLQRWHAKGLDVCPISVNISARQFRSLELLSMIRSVLDETGVDPRLLEVEITETTLMHNTEETLSILGQLHALGIKISVDDFGTGYSSLAYLKRFPVDLLKIDRSFVHDLVTDADDAIIVSAIIGLARSLQLRVVAEGVETPEQVDFLKRRGCDEVQGFLFSKPLPAAQIESLFNLRY
ncbi:EAL domain-containing protein [Schlegelella sp. S2-27]|uniref:EAL domain-containing protein n=1 Tax=Caldimonas mangrovi TaxID=2944811 RepID=A0ABT0YMG3_9BURK|nr:EAL domain-containing protein [Caldimonas mangrovi]MCM5679068.1 EAL domain-containing protein [Caldimonas mangrovi]